MSDPLVLEIIKAIISGLFGLLAAIVPIYIQNRRPKEKAVRSYAEGRSEVHPIYIGLFSLLAFLFWSAVITLSVFIISALGIVLGPSAENQSIAVFGDGNLRAVSQDEYWQLALKNSYFYEAISLIVDALLIGPALLIGRYAGRRADRLGVATLLGGVVLAMAIIKITSKMNEASYDLQYNYEVLFVILHLAAAFSGYYWGRRRRGSYLMVRIYKRMDAADRACLLDLAQEVVVAQGASKRSENQLAPNPAHAGDGYRRP